MAKCVECLKPMDRWEATEWEECRECRSKGHAHRVRSSSPTDAYPKGQEEASVWDTYTNEQLDAMIAKAWEKKHMPVRRKALD